MLSSKKFRSSAAKAILGAVFLLALLIDLFFIAAIFTAWKPEGADFFAFYTGGKLFIEDRPYLYDLEAQYALQKELAPDSPALKNQGAVLGFLHPPFVAAAFAPLAILPYRAAYFSFVALNFALFAGIIWLFRARLGLSWQHLAILAVLGLFSVIGQYVLMGSQLSFFVLLLLGLFVFDLRDGRARAGLWAGLLLIKPQFAPIPIVAMLAHRAWRGLGIFASIAGLLAMLSLALLGWSGVSDYVSVLRHAGTAINDFPGFNSVNQSNLRGLLGYFPNLGNAWLVAGAIVAIITYLIQRSEADYRLRFSAAIAALLLVAPHLMIHDLAVLLLPAALLLSQYGSRVLPWLASALLAINAMWVIVNFGLTPYGLLSLGLFVFCSILVFAKSHGVKSFYIRTLDFIAFFHSLRKV